MADAEYYNGSSWKKWKDNAGIKYYNSGWNSCDEVKIKKYDGTWETVFKSGFGSDMLSSTWSSLSGGTSYMTGAGRLIRKHSTVAGGTVSGTSVHTHGTTTLGLTHGFTTSFGNANQGARSGDNAWGSPESLVSSFYSHTSHTHSYSFTGHTGKNNVYQSMTTTFRSNCSYLKGGYSYIFFEPSMAGYATSLVNSGMITKETNSNYLNRYLKVGASEYDHYYNSGGTSSDSTVGTVSSSTNSITAPNSGQTEIRDGAYLTTYRTTSNHSHGFSCNGHNHDSSITGSRTSLNRLNLIPYKVNVDMNFIPVGACSFFKGNLPSIFSNVGTDYYYPFMTSSTSVALNEAKSDDTSHSLTSGASYTIGSRSWSAKNKNGTLRSGYKAYTASSHSGYSGSHTHGSANCRDMARVYLRFGRKTRWI